MPGFSSDKRPCVPFFAVSAGCGNLSKSRAVRMTNDLLSIYDKSQSVSCAIVCHIRLKRFVAAAAAAATVSGIQCAQSIADIHHMFLCCHETEYNRLSQELYVRSHSFDC